jgi:hypothetical protein
MKRQFSSLAFLVAFLSASPASARAFHAASDAVAPANSPADVLRSAFYLRDSGRDRATAVATSKELQHSLRRHFDVVLVALLASSERSLAVALDRLEQSRGEHWTDDQRAAWRKTLVHRRALNIRRLRLYQLRGLFPRNEHTAGSAVPIFVDNHDTACAVGHLMRESGWGDAVAAIQRANNFVYVTDARDGPLVDWVLVSGLTQEEAALIQPSYFPPLFDKKFDVLTQGGSITKNGLHYDNFHFIAGELVARDAFPEVPPPVNQIDLATYGAASRQGVFQSLSGTIDPMFNDWLFLGATSDFYSINGSDEPWGVLFSYDVAPVNPQRHFVAASLESFAANYNFLNSVQGVLQIDASIYADGSTQTSLAELSLGNGLPFGFFLGADSASFEPQDKLTVVGAVKVVGAATFTSIVHSFELAPEASDFDSDGDVDGADFLAWQKGVGIDDAAPTQGDANGDGVADAADLEMWKQQAFGAAAAAIDRAPEPAAAGLAGLACAIALGLRRRRE